MIVFQISNLICNCLKKLTKKKLTNDIDDFYQVVEKWKRDGKHAFRCNRAMSKNQQQNL